MILKSMQVQTTILHNKYSQYDDCGSSANYGICITCGMESAIMCGFNQMHDYKLDSLCSHKYDNYVLVFTW